MTMLPARARCAESGRSDVAGPTWQQAALLFDEVHGAVVVIPAIGAGWSPPVGVSSATLRVIRRIPRPRRLALANWSDIGMPIISQLIVAAILGCRSASGNMLPDE
jgi:hypothetical protein